MDYQKIGDFIAQCRKDKGLTQKQLAEHLGVTDKAVSKWERGQSCPDIALLAPLAELLGVEIGEILGGEKSAPAEKSVEQVQRMVEHAIDYTAKNSKERWLRLRLLLWGGLLASLFIAGAVCLICDMSISRQLTWSPMVLACLVYGGFMFYPLLGGKGRPVRGLLIMASIATLPFLLVLSALLGETLVATMGCALAVVSLLTLWFIYWLSKKMRARPFRVIACSVLACLPLNFAIGGILWFFIQDWVMGNTMINLLGGLLLAGLFFGIDWFVETAWRKR